MKNFRVENSLLNWMEELKAFDNANYFYYTLPPFLHGFYNSMLSCLLVLWLPFWTS